MSRERPRKEVIEETEFDEEGTPIRYMKERIRLAKKLLDSILKRVKPKKKLEKIILKLAKEARKELKRTYSCSESDIFGVFGKDGSFKAVIGKEEGKKLVQRISGAIAKKFKRVVVTGGTIYSCNKIGGKVISKRILINRLEKKSKEDGREGWRTMFSKILGHIPQSGIFLIDDSRSASIHEEGSFIQEERDFGLAVIISKKQVRFCRGNNLIQIKTNRMEYYQCSNEADYNKCIKGGSGCFLLKLNLNKTTVEPFIRKRDYFLIIIEDLRKIERIVTKAIIENYSK